MPDPYVDESLICIECSEEFVFSVEEQQYHAQQGYQNKPRRCRSCRTARRERNAQGAQGPRAPRPGPREYHAATCASCGQEARVPFKPRGDKPVYCSACFKPAPR